MLNLKMCEITPGNHRFWSKVEFALKIPVPYYLKNVLMLSGLQNTETMGKLTSDIIMELEHLMRSFPTFLSKHAEDENIPLTKTEELRIYKCFQDSIMTDSVDFFCNFAFRNGDKSLLLCLARLATKEHVPNGGYDCTDMAYCNPNAIFETLRTMVGNFYCGDENSADVFDEQLDNLKEIDKLFNDLKDLSKTVSSKKNLKRSNNIARQKANESSKANENRHLNARRFDPEYMAYCSYLHMSGGPKTFKTMKLNDYDAMPSVHSIEKYIYKNKVTITEGKLRHSELAEYLKALKLDPYVSLSEDATNVTGTFEYSPKLNQIIGLVPPKCKETGMPIPSSFAATSATAIDSILLNPNIPLANMVNVVMAQPLALNTPAFCLLIYGGNGQFSKEEVGMRWEFIVRKLAEVGVKVINFASDSDPRYNGAMKDLVLKNLTDESSQFPEWYQFDCTTADYVPMQDNPHVGTKLRNRISNEKCDLTFGTYSISMEHLLTLIRTVSRDKHGLFESYISNKDKMNFLSVQKITEPKVLEYLKKHVEGSDGTVMYLKLTNMFLRAFLDRSLTPLDRIRNVWYVVFVLRIWKEFITRHPKQNSKHFISSYTYNCIEINAHSLVSIVLFLKANGLERLFFPHLMDSQPCESFFREFRSFTTVGSSVSTTTILGMIHRCERIALMNEISRSKLKNFTFVTDSKRNREIYYNTNRDGYRTNTLPCIAEIISGIEGVKEKAITDCVKLGVILDGPFDFKSHVKPSVRKKKEKPVPMNTFTPNDGTKLTRFKNLQLKNYSDKIDFAKFDEKSSYVAIDDVNLDGNGERRIYVRKSTLCKLYINESTKLSADRTRRVMQRAPCKQVDCSDDEDEFTTMHLNLDEPERCTLSHSKETSEIDLKEFLQSFELSEW